VAVRTLAMTCPASGVGAGCANPTGLDGRQPSAVARRARRAHDGIGHAPGRVRPQAANGRLQVIGPDRAERDFEGTQIS
jgi:hypothetical protein